MKADKGGAQMHVELECSKNTTWYGSCGFSGFPGSSYKKADDTVRLVNEKLLRTDLSCFDPKSESDSARPNIRGRLRLEGGSWNPSAGGPWILFMAFERVIHWTCRIALKFEEKCGSNTAA